ncbi:MAG: hypothetical protein GF416_01765 [Candidatus Altiarchaeales archaeon]|nr:hypothetical protein [Candidatus Altiarchaeales archaeon]MBD3415843.1 hypothetical protein [Candidatus Altiarchaeales archaeon]
MVLIYTENRKIYSNSQQDLIKDKMKGSTKSGSGPSEGLRDYVLAALSKIGLSVSSVEVRGEHEVRVFARTEHKAVDNSVFVEARKQKRRVGRHEIEKLKEWMDDENSDSGVFISLSGFTDEAYEYASERGIRAFTPEDLDGFGSERHVSPEHHIYAKVFEEAVDLVGATNYFNARRRKSLFGLGGYVEDIDFVEGRYAPVGVFELKRKADPRQHPTPNTTVGGENTFFINLTSCEIYYLYLGVAGRGARLKASNVLRRMMDLSEPAVRIIGDIVGGKELLFEDMDVDQKLLMQEDPHMMAYVENLGLVWRRDDGRGYLSNIDLPPFNDTRYNLYDHLAVKESVESRCPADEIVYPPSGLLQLLKDFMKSDGEFHGVIYMPYYYCRFVGSNGAYRYETLDNIRFKNG